MQTIQEMCDFLVEKGVLARYEKNKISADTWERTFYFTDGSGVDFWDTDEALIYLRGMVKAYEIMSKTPSSIQS